MARPRSRFRNFLEYAIARFAVATLRFTPRPLSEALGRRYVALLDRGIPRLRQAGLGNLEQALPELTAEQRARTIDGVFASVGRTLVAFAKFPQIDRKTVNQWIRYEGIEHLDRAHARGKGVLFATAHLGNWELSAFAHALLSRPMHVLVRPLDNPLLENYVERRRALSGNTIVAKKNFLRPVLQALARNEAVGILVDHNALAEEGLFVNFFGIPACTSPAFAKLAAHSGAAVVPGYAFWSPVDQQYILRFHPELEITGDTERDTQTVQRAVEDAVRAHPDQWLWIHRRWKTRPQPLAGRETATSPVALS